MTIFDDPNREAVGLEPIWSGSDDNAPNATGATAGTPGMWTPAGADPPTDPSNMAGITATPTSAWATGEYVQTATAGGAGQVHWDGTGWVAGQAATRATAKA